MVAFVASTPLRILGKPTDVVSSQHGPCMVAGKTIGETLISNPNYSVVNKLLKAASIDLDALGGGTFFAPNNKAFSALHQKLIDELEESTERSTAILLRHFLPKETVTVSDMRDLGCGHWYTVPGGPLSFLAAGVVSIQISGASMNQGIPEDSCDNGVIHTMRDVINYTPRQVSSLASSNGLDIKFGSIGTTAIQPKSSPGKQWVRARNAASKVSSVGGRKAMGLMSQLPFWMYGPPFNAAKQEEYEPISIAIPSPGTGIDYQLMPPGSIVVEPDEVSADKLNPVSGMSKYIGKTKRLVEGDALSDYSRLDDL